MSLYYLWQAIISISIKIQFVFVLSWCQCSCNYNYWCNCSSRYGINRLLCYDTHCVCSTWLLTQWCKSCPKRSLYWESINSHCHRKDSSRADHVVQFLVAVDPHPWWGWQMWTPHSIARQHCVLPFLIDRVSMVAIPKLWNDVAVLVHWKLEWANERANN